MFWSGCWSWRGKEGENECGEGVSSEGIRGSAPAITSADLEFPFPVGLGMVK